MREIKRCVKLVLPIVPLRMIIYFIIALPSIVIPMVMLRIQQKLIDTVINTTSLRKIELPLRLVILLLILYLVMKLFDIFSEHYMEFGCYKFINIHLQERIQNKMNELPLEKYENTEMFQVLEQGKNSSMFVIFTASLFTHLIQILIGLGIVSTYILNIYPVLLLFIFFTAFPVFLERILIAKQKKIYLKLNTQTRREVDYYSKILSSSEHVKEIKINKGIYYFLSLWKKGKSKILESELEISRTNFNVSSFYNVLRSISHGIAFLIILNLLLNHKLTVGEFSALLSSFAVITNNISNFMSFAGEIGETGMLSEAFFELLDMEIKDGEDRLSETNDIIFEAKNVNYHYPGNETNALNNVNFAVGSKEVIAIVGENGSGKSTLIKLMTGMLKASEGEVLINKKNINDLQEKSVLEYLSAVFQIYGKYKMTIEENIFISDLSQKDNLELVKSALRWSGMELDGKKILGKEFGGTELSGGQWQKIALARCYFRNRPVIFMDEPTSAIDPLEEVRIYNKLIKLAYGKTVIIVTHRLGSVKSANRIFVLHEGNIVETGSFQELIEKKGYFERMWKEQSKWYDRA